LIAPSVFSVNTDNRTTQKPKNRWVSWRHLTSVVLKIKIQRPHNTHTPWSSMAANFFFLVYPFLPVSLDCSFWLPLLYFLTFIYYHL
jgi:hypothetical protein